MKKIKVNRLMQNRHNNKPKSQNLYPRTKTTKNLTNNNN